MFTPLLTHKVCIIENSYQSSLTPPPPQWTYKSLAIASFFQNSLTLRSTHKCHTIGSSCQSSLTSWLTHKVVMTTCWLGDCWCMSLEQCKVVWMNSICRLSFPAIFYYITIFFLSNHCHDNGFTNQKCPTSNNCQSYLILPKFILFSWVVLEILLKCNCTQKYWYFQKHFTPLSLSLSLPPPPPIPP